MAKQSFSSRSSVTGPATGGILVIPLHQKRAGQAAARDEDVRCTPLQVYAVAASFTTHQALPTGQGVHLKASEVHTLFTSGGRNVLRKVPGAGGDGSVFSLDVGWSETALVEGYKALNRPTAGLTVAQPLSALSLWVDDDATATAAFNVQAIVYAAVRGHRYDPDNTYTGPGAGATATSKPGYPYDTLKD